MWMVMLGIQSLPYAATLITAKISARANRKPETLPADTPTLSKAA
jgi:hypothetical protein